MKVGKIDLRHEAVADKQFETALKASNAQGKCIASRVG